MLDQTLGRRRCTNVIGPTYVLCLLECVPLSTTFSDNYLKTELIQYTFHIEMQLFDVLEKDQVFSREGHTVVSLKTG